MIKNIVMIYSAADRDARRGMADRLRAAGYRPQLRNPYQFSDPEPCEIVVVDGDFPVIDAAYAGRARFASLGELLSDSEFANSGAVSPVADMDGEAKHEMDGSDGGISVSEQKDGKENAAEEFESMSDDELRLYLQTRGVRVKPTWSRAGLVRRAVAISS